jgi:hypothetical protein
MRGLYQSFLMTKIKDNEAPIAAQESDATRQMESNPRSFHTPGPWLFDGRSIVAGNSRHMLRDGVGWSQADARLIAAAPELLAACKSANACLAAQMYGTSSSPRRQILAAITKAEGGSSVEPQGTKSDAVSG